MVSTLVTSMNKVNKYEMEMDELGMGEEWNEKWMEVEKGVGTENNEKMPILRGGQEWKSM